MSVQLAHDGASTAIAEVSPSAPAGHLEGRPAKPYDLEGRLAIARTRIPPLWPLQNFVAVNPFLGLTNQHFDDACEAMRSTAGADMLMPREYYRAWIAEGRILEADLAHALRTVPNREGLPSSVSALRDAIRETPSYVAPSIVTAVEIIDRVRGEGVAIRVVEQISKWCSAYYDQGQAPWIMPWRSLPAYPAWRAALRIDRTPDLMGFAGFREAIDSLPTDPVDTIQFVLEALGVPEAAIDAYLHRALFSVRGWVAYTRYLGWYDELRGESDDGVLEMLAIRLAWDYGLYATHHDSAFTTAWDDACAKMASAAAGPSIDYDLRIDAILQAAFEASFQRSLLDRLTSKQVDAVSGERPSVQAAFCIDVRSEIIRRALEATADNAQTIGFAGFFGFPIEYVPIGQRKGAAQCPVLLEPKFVVRETVAGTDSDEQTEILGLRLLRRRAAKAWKTFKGSAVSSFVYVETAGLMYAAKLLGDTTGVTRPVTHPFAEGLDPKVLARTGPEIDTGSLGKRATGLTDSARIATATGMLRGMSLTRGFSRLVMLAGHGSTMVNNPHASGYDCGACGGSPGEANARVAAATLNDPAVRAGLAAEGISIPDDTWFLGALHDTTTDEITIFDRDAVPASHQNDLVLLDGALREAAAIARQERAKLLNLSESGDVHASIERRTRDWSQVRPEWGLAGNAAFIAAPRARTRGIDLSGR
ncbi:MAG: DUF2309 domain-containing protein, partial [Polyangiales bacterium]